MVCHGLTAAAAADMRGCGPHTHVLKNDPTKVVMAAQRPDFRRECAWQESNLRPRAPEARALSPELQARSFSLALSWNPDAHVGWGEHRMRAL